MTNDLLPDDLKYWWADNEEGPYQGPFDSRDLAISDAYTYCAKCFDDPSQTDGLFMIKTKGLLVDAVESPQYILSIDVTDEFYDAWKRANEPDPLAALLFKKQIDYSAYLQQIIEALCHGHPIPEPETAAAHHYEMAVEYRKHTPQPSPQSGVVDLDAIEDELAEQIKREYPKNWRAVETGMLIGVRHLASTGRIRGEWRPISEAPRDGTEILGAVEYHPSYVKNAHHIHQVSWNLDAWRISGMRGAKAFVTHWMPLPASPGGE